MSSVIISGDTSGSVTLQAPATAGSTVVTLPIASMNIGNGGGNSATNTAFGAANALGNNTTGLDNSAFGRGALLNNTSGNQNSGFAEYALINNTTGSSNSGFGYQALQANTTASNNTAVGSGSLMSNTTAGNNTAVGYFALQANTTGDNNVAIGTWAGTTLTTGGYSVFVGRGAGYNTLTGTQNTFIGANAGYGNSTGNYNTFVGTRNSATSGCGQFMTGSANTILGGFDGNMGGLDIRSSSNYIVLSDGAGNPRGLFSSSGQFIVGATSYLFSPPTTSGASFQASNTGGGSPIVEFVNTNTTSGSDGSPAIIACKASATTSSSARFIQFSAGGTSQQMGAIVGNGAGLCQFVNLSDAREKTNIAPLTNALSRVTALKPSTFNMISTDEYISGGFIAQEVKEVFPEYVVENIANEGAEQRYGLTGGMTGGYIAVLTAAIQEQQTIINELKSRIETLESE